jgi:hypothetical protein
VQSNENYITHNGKISNERRLTIYIPMFAFSQIISALQSPMTFILRSHSQSTSTQSTPVLASVLDTLLPGIICLPTVCISAGGLPTQNTSPSHKSYQHPIEGPTFFSNATFRRFAAFIDAILLGGPITTLLVVFLDPILEIWVGVRKERGDERRAKERVWGKM